MNFLKTKFLKYLTLSCFGLLILLVSFAFISQINPIPERKTLVLYAYLEKSTKFKHADSLKYFLELGVSPNDPVDYVFIIQNFK
jgi:hypothetical protein